MTPSVIPVPCTIITGFLGAGKTTLVRHLLQHPGNRRLAVIVNEFGEAGVDAAILRGCGIPACEDAAIVELANGCLCCTVADDFVPALDALLALPTPPDHILIETSGLALPKPLVQAFRWPAIRGRVTVDGVVAVVDGMALAAGRVAADLGALASQRAADPALEHENPVEEVFADQVACADLVVLSKADLLDEAGLARAQTAVQRALPPAASLLTSHGGHLDPAVLLGLGLAAEDDIASRSTLHDAEADHDHDDFETVAIPLPECDDPAALARRVAAVCASPAVLRAKGFAAVANKPMRLLLQGVGPRVNHHYDRPWSADEAREGRLVVIGLKGFDQAAAARTLAGR